MSVIGIISQSLDWIEANPVVGTAILAGSAFLFQALLKTTRKESVIVKPAFWTLGKKFHISAVIEYIPSNNSSGYTQKQYSRPDQWKEIIDIKSAFWKCRHKITPKKPKDIIVVNISRNGREKEKIIKFNK